jgi:hypothetical protein
VRGAGHGRRTRIDHGASIEVRELPPDRPRARRVKEIERLIKKLEIDKEILADEGEEAAADEES